MPKTKLHSYQGESNRRENCRQLVAAHCDGKLVRFAEKIDRPPHQVQNWIGKTPNRNISKDMARHIEICFSKPEGWLDVDHSASAYTSSPFSRLSQEEQNALVLSMLDALDDEGRLAALRFLIKD